MDHTISAGLLNRINHMPSQAQPIHVVSVDSTSAQAKGIMVELIQVSVQVHRTASQVTDSWKAVEKDYNLVHVANCEGEAHYSAAVSAADTLFSDQRC